MNATRQQLQAMAAQAAARHGIPANVFQRLIAAESSWNPAAVGPPIQRMGGTTAKGLGQFLDSTWQTWGNGGNVFDPAANLDASARYLSALQHSHGGNLGAAVLAYGGWGGQIPAYQSGGSIKPGAADYLGKIVGGETVPAGIPPTAAAQLTPIEAAPWHQGVVPAGPAPHPAPSTLTPIEAAPWNAPAAAAGNPAYAGNPAVSPAPGLSRLTPIEAAPWHASASPGNAPAAVTPAPAKAAGLTPIESAPWNQGAQPSD